MFQMNPLEILTLALLLLVVAGCVLVVVVALRWLRRIGLQQEQAGVGTAQAELARAQAEAEKARADLARAQAEAARREALAHDARAEREAADASRADADAALAAARTRLADVSAQHVEARVQLAKDDAERARAEAQRATADEERLRAEARRAEAETRLADTQADAVRGGLEPRDADGSVLFTDRNGSGSPVVGAGGGAGPLGSVGRFLPGQGKASDWNDSLAELFDVLGSWGGKAGRDTSASGFPIDPRLLNLLPEDARKLLGGLKRPEDAEALFEWLRARFGDPSQNRRRGPGASRRPAGFQPDDPDSDVAGRGGAGSEDGENGTGVDGTQDENGTTNDEGGRGSAAPPAGLWVEDDAAVDKASRAGNPDNPDHPDNPDNPGEPGTSGTQRETDKPANSGTPGDPNKTGEPGRTGKPGRADGRSAAGARSAEDRGSDSGAEQVSDGGPGANVGSSWGGPWTGGLDVDALIEEALRVRHLYENRRHSRRRRGDTAGEGESEESHASSEGEPSAESHGESEGKPSADAGSEQPGGEVPGAPAPADDDSDDAPDGSTDGDA